MQRILILLVILTGTLRLHAQALESGTLGFQIGYDAAVHGSVTRTEVKGIPAVDTGGALTQMFNIGVQYNFASWFSAGVSFDYGSYVEDTADAGADGNTFNTFSFDARLYPVNKDKFNWYVGGQGGYTNLFINRIDPVTTLDASYKYASPHLGLFTGFNWYIFNVAGVFFQVDYSSHNFTLKELTLANVVQDLTYIEQTLDTKGVGVRVGVAFYIN